MKTKQIEQWIDDLNYVSGTVEELMNPANEEDVRALDKLDGVIDGLFSLKKELDKQNQKKKEKIQMWNESIKNYIETKKDVK